MKVGDKVTLIRGGITALNGFEDGDEVEIGAISEYKTFKFTVKKGGLTGFAQADNLKVKENTMTKFKVGDRVKIAESSGFYTRGSVSNPRDVEGTVRRLTDGSIGSLNTDVIWDNGRKNSYGDNDLELVEKSLDNLVVGDRIDSEDGDREREVVAVGPKYIATIDKYDETDDTRVWTRFELKDNDYKVKQESQFVEVTLADIANKFNIPVSELRIKENK